MSMCGYMHKSTSAQRGEKRTSDSTALKLQVLVSCPTWVLGRKLGSSARAANSLTQ